MQVKINGEEKKIPGNLTVEQLLLELDLPSKHVIVELNHNILAAGQYTETKLNTGDCLELVQFVGGG